MTDKPNAYLASTAAALEAALTSVSYSLAKVKSNIDYFGNVIPEEVDDEVEGVTAETSAAIASVLAYMEDRLDALHDFFVEAIATAIADLEERIEGLGIPVGETVAELAERVWRIVNVIMGEIEELKYRISHQAMDLTEVTRVIIEGGNEASKGWLEETLESIEAGLSMGFDFMSDMFKDTLAAPFAMLFELFVSFFFEEVEE